MEARCGWRRDVHEEHEDYVGKLRWSSRREKGQYRSNDAREDDVRKLTLSSRQEKGRKERKMADEMKQKIAECKTGTGRT